MNWIFTEKHLKFTPMCREIIPMYISLTFLCELIIYR